MMGAQLRCDKCHQYKPDRCTCKRMMRTAELTAALLDYWVARAEGFKWADDITPEKARGVPPYSTDWAQGGPIIERERLIIAAGNNYWAAIDTNPANGLIYEICEVGRHGCTGPTPLVAAMRAYVASKFGEVVEDVQRAAQLDGGQGEGGNECQQAT